MFLIMGFVTVACQKKLCVSSAKLILIYEWRLPPSDATYEKEFFNILKQRATKLFWCFGF